MASPIISGLTSTAQGGAPFTLTGSNFGSPDPLSFVWAFPGTSGDMVQCEITTWTATQIDGVLPLNLQVGENGYLVVQVMSDPTGAKSPGFVILAPLVIASVQYPPGEFIQTNTASAKDTSGDFLPEMKEAHGQIVSYQGGGDYECTFVEGTLLDGPTNTAIVNKGYLTQTGKLSLEQYRALPIRYYQQEIIED